MYSGVSRAGMAFSNPVDKNNRKDIIPEFAQHPSFSRFNRRQFPPGTNLGSE
jgi:hypothetical protein